MKRTPRQLTDIARECRRIYDAAVTALGSDLGGSSVLDLMADNIEHVSLQDLKAAIAISGIPTRYPEMYRSQGGKQIDRPTYSGMY